jgi:DNA primase catalytic core
MILNVEEILNAVTLESVIGESVQLKKRGANLSGLCPFHDEKTESFSVSPSKGVYKCFGCGKGGNNAANFIMDRDNITFPEAMEILSSKGGIKIIYADGETREAVTKKAKEYKIKKEKQIDVMKSAYNLLIEKCSIKTDDTEFIELAGKKYHQYSLDKWKMTLTSSKPLLAVSDLDKDTMMDIGLIAKKDNGKPYDFFYDRLLFPIHNVSGHIEGIIGRDVINRDKKYKYLNSKESELYNKSESLFGLYFALAEIRRKDYVYLVEGPTDVILMHQNQIYNVVCSAGTGFTAAQAKILKRYTDLVKIVPDGDAAGLKGAQRSVEILIEHQMQADIVILPDGEDPASFIDGLEDIKEWDDYTSLHTHEGLKWRVSRELKEKNEHYKHLAIIVAARMLSSIDSDTLKDQYITSLAKLIDTKQKYISDELKNENDKKLTKKPTLSTTQLADKAKYGIYIQNKNYLNENGIDLSNFIMKPLFLVRAGAKSYRLFEIVNEDNETVLLSSDSDDITMLSTFKKRVEMHGNYLFFGDERYYIKLRRLIYSEMTKAYTLPHLGYIKSTGVYAWGNGVTTPDGDFIKTDEYGIVKYNDIVYYLPAFSNINLQEVIKVEDQADYEKKFVYRAGDYDAKTWYYDFSKVFGDNAILGLGFYAATIFKDYFQDKNTNFPLLNLFGPAGAGKTTMAEQINCMFGEPINPIHCINATDAAFYRRPAQTCNAVNLFEEYSDIVDKKRQQTLKAFYDGMARPMAKKESSNRNESLAILSSIILIGQVLPTHDPALLERCITLFFDESTKTGFHTLLEKLKKEGKKGHLTHITALLHSKRNEVISKFDEDYKMIKNEIIKHMGDIKIPDRLLINYNTILTMYFILTEILDVEMAMPFDRLISFTCTRIKTQMQVNQGSTEITEFWSMLEYLVSKKIITWESYEVALLNEATLVDQSDKNNTSKVVFDLPKRVLSFRLNNVHREYMRESRTQNTVRTLDMNTITFYLVSSKAFIGECKSKRLNGHSPSRVWMFDLDLIENIQLELTGDNKNEMPFS